MKITNKLFLSLTVAVATSLTSSAGAAISVGAGGAGPFAFGTTPTVADGWSTTGVGANNTAYNTVGDIDTAAQTIVASTVTTALGNSPTVPPSTAAIFRHNTVGFYLQSRSTTVGANVLVATLTNTTGLGISSITVQYAFNELVGGLGEEVPGLHAYYSLTGAASGWTKIPAFSTGTPGTLSATLAVGTWPANSQMYLMWLDDNANNGTNPGQTPGNEGGYTIDDFTISGVVTISGGTPTVALTSPANGASAFAPATINLTSTATGGSGSVSNVAYFYTNSGAVTIVGTSASGPTYPVSTAPLAVGSYGFYAVTTNTSGATAFSGTNVVTVVPPLASLTFLQQPSQQLVGAVIAPEVQVGATNSLGAAMTGIPVSLSLTGGGTLGGTVTQNTDGSGIAHFANLTVSTVGSKTLIATNAGSLISGTSASFSITNSPPIFVGTTGSGTNLFNALPAVTQWSTFNIQGAHNATRTDGDWDTCMTTNGAANINSPLTSKADNGNLATAYWRSDVLQIETRPTNPGVGSGAATLLMATLNNSSGATINTLDVNYLMSDTVTTTESRKGHRVYYSTTGATNSWTAVGNFNIADNSTNNIAFSLTSLGWAANTSMYIVWLDEDGLSPDGDYGIDNISCTPPGGGPTPPQYLAITQSGADKIISWTNASAVLQQTTNLLDVGTAWSTVPGATSPFTNSVTSGQRLYRLLVP